MPIRFRCAYCNQLLGIARRKSGTVVRCPTCAGQVVVPTADSAEAMEPEPELKAPSKQPLFERSDFDDLFNNPVPAGEEDEGRTAGAAPRGAGGGAAAGTAAPPAPSPSAEEAWGTHADPEPAVEPVGVSRDSAATFEPMPRMSGIVLSPAKATVLTVVVVVGLAVAFAAGLLVGRFLLTGS
jgi:hypothetical protein